MVSMCSRLRNREDNTPCPWQVPKSRDTHTCCIVVGHPLHPGDTHLIVVFMFQVPATDGALASGVRGVGAFLGGLCDTAFDLEGRETRVSEGEEGAGPDPCMYTPPPNGGEGSPLGV